MSERVYSRVPATITITVNGKPKVYEVELDIVGVKNSVTGTVAILEKSLASGYFIPDGGPYSMKSTYGEEMVSVENGWRVAHV